MIGNISCICSKNSEVLEYASMELRNDRHSNKASDFVSITSNDNALTHASMSLRSKREIVFIVVQKNSMALVKFL